MRHKKRTDANQSEITTALRALPGVSVQDLSEVGEGCPDLLVGACNRNLLLEVKVPGKTLNARQRRWHEAWRGQRVTVETPLGALLALLTITKDEPTVDVPVRHAIATYKLPDLE